MPFFWQKAKDDKVNKPESKQPSTLRTVLDVAFNPHFGRSLEPLQETNQVFVYLLASIFIAQKMFPANHPAYFGKNGQRLTLGILLSTVWRDLKFTKESMPQVLLFSALVSGIVFSTLAVLLFLISLFIGTAHAQSYFISSAGDDIAQQWLNFLFQGSTSGGFISGLSGQPMSMAAGLQQALITALGFYSDAILVVAAAVLFYLLASMVVNTAHEGQIMGKQANQVWAPIRLVVAIGLLVPIGGGLNSGQFIVITVAGWGSALASNVWEIFVGSLPQGGGIGFVPGIAAEVVQNTILSEACRAAYNSYDNEAANTSGGQANNLADKTTGGNAGQGKCIENGQSGTHNSGICGCHSFNNSSGQNAGSGQGCYSEMQGQAQSFAQQEAKYFTDKHAGGQADQPTPPNSGQYGDILQSYMSCLGGAMTSADLSGCYGQSAANGWVSAGAALSCITKTESNANDTSGMIPTVQGPDFGGGGDNLMKKKAKRITGLVRQHMDSATSGSGGGGGSIGSDACAGSRGQALQDAIGIGQLGKSHDHFLDRILQVIDIIANWECVYNSYGNMAIGIQFTGANPLAEMAALGHRMINAAYDTFDLMVNLNAEAGTAIKSDSIKAEAASEGGVVGAILKMGPEAAKEALAAISALLSFITSTFLVGGIMLAYYLPLIPFMKFLFSVLAWVIAVLEAVIAVPMIALGHLTVGGEGLPGNSKAAYFFVFNIMLKPVLMVFGLMVGLMTFNIAVSYMNMFYAMAIGTDGGLATGHLLLTRLIDTALYVLILYGVANNVFKAIEWLPAHAMKWLGQQSMNFMPIDPSGQIAGQLAQTSERFASTAGQMGSSLGGSLMLGGGQGGGSGVGGHSPGGGKNLSGGQPHGGRTVSRAEENPKGVTASTGGEEYEPDGDQDWAANSAARAQWREEHGKKGSESKEEEDAAHKKWSLAWKNKHPAD
jgi:hypothetical protein